MIFGGVVCINCSETDAWLLSDFPRVYVCSRGHIGRLRMMDHLFPLSVYQ